MLNAKVTSNLPLVRKRYNQFFRRFPNIRFDTGRQFVPYSPSYAEEKGKITVNLQDTNKMLQSIDSKIKNKNQVQLFFRSQTQARKALFHQKGLGKLPERPFFGFNFKTEKIIKRSFEQFMKKEIKRLKI